MPLINAPLDTYIELQYLLKKEESFLIEKDYLEKRIRLDEDNKLFCLSIGLDKVKDYINASKEQITKLFQRKQLYQYILETLAHINWEYVYSFVKNHMLLAPGQAIDIIKGDDYRFLNRPINIYLYPQFASRLKKAMDKVNIVTYADLKNFINNGPMIDFRGLGLESSRALNTIIISDYRYLKGNRLLKKQNSNGREKTTLELFEELLKESWESLNRKWDLVYLRKWKHQREYLREDVIFTLKRLYGRKNAAIILNSFYEGDNRESYDMLAYNLEVSYERIEYVETVLKRRYLAAFIKLKMINDKKENRANAFFRRLIKLGKNEIAPFIGLLMWFDPVYSVIMDMISDTFPTIGELLENIKDYMESFVSMAEA